MCGKSSNTTTTQVNQPSAEQTAAYKYVTGVAENAAALPLQQYTGDRVAGFTPDQQSAFSAVDNAQGIQTPYLNAASQYAAQGAQAITPEKFSADAVNQYLNPYTQNVIDTTMANTRINDKNAQNDLLGKAISSGASPFGGDRAGIAAAELGRNQSLARDQTIAGLQSDAYNSALSTWGQQQGVDLGAQQNNASRAANAGTQFASLGNQAQSQALTGASALLQTGNLQQQQNQTQLDNAYSDFQQQQQYPRDVANWLINAINGNPTNLGSTETKTTSADSGNSLTSIIGALTSLGSLFKSRGGGVEGYDNGGAVDGAWRGGHMLNPVHVGYMGRKADRTGTSGGRLQSPIDVGSFDDGGLVDGSYQDDPRFTWGTPISYGINIPMLRQSVFSISPTTEGINWNGGGATSPVTSIPSRINALPQISQDAMPAPRTYQLPSGLLAAIQNVPAILKQSQGGGIEGYAMGGDTMSRDDFDVLSNPMPTMPLGDIKPVVPAGLEPVTAPTAPAEQIAAPTSIMPDNSKSAKSPAAAGVDAHPVVDDSGPTMRVYYPSEKKWIDLGVPSAKAADPQGGFLDKIVGPDFLTSPRSALFDAGLAMMASKSPNVLTGVGEGLQAGVGAWEQRKAAQAVLDANANAKAQELDIQRQDLEIKKWQASHNGYRPATPDDLKANGLPEGTPAQVEIATNKLVTIGGGLSGGLVGDDEIKAVANSIRSAMTPPTIASGRPTRYTIGIMADLATPTPEFPKGFNLSKANQDWTATTKYLSTLNSNQMLTLRNSISQVDQSINMLTDLNDKWQAGNYPPINSIRGDAAKLGALGPEAQSIYTQMQTQIADVTAEMGAVLMKGNTPTDEGLRLAAKNLDINSPYATFVDSLALMRENISYKKNSMQLGPAGVGENPYTSGLTQPAPVIDSTATPPTNITNPGSAVPPSVAPPTQGAPASGDQPPISTLKEGFITTFGDGQKWTLQSGKPVKVQ